MNQTLQQSRAIHDALRQRAAEARAEFAAKPRFVVVPHQHNLFGIVDRQTGVERAEVAGHNNACHAAQSFENVSDFAQAARLSVGHVARWTLRWTVVLGATLAVFAFYGMHQ